MEQFIIKGGNALSGEVEISGAKNAALALIAAAIMTDETVTIENLPDVRDVNVLLESIEQIGATVERLNPHCVKINGKTIKSTVVDYEHIKKIRASYYLLGALLGKFNEAEVALPGGCNIGSRPIDQHLKGFKALGADVEVEYGMIVTKADKLVGNHIYFDVVSVGATINVMLAAAMADGNTNIENAAKEPHVVDVANMLNKMGANIKGAGTNVITIEGVKQLQGCYHEIIPDRIEAGTFVIMAAACADEMRINNVIPKHIEALTSKLTEMGADLEIGIDSILVRRAEHMHAADVTTKPYPGFATDLQQPLTALLTQVEGISEVTDTIYTERFKHCLELQRMGANIELYNGKCEVKGPSKLYGDRVTATDLRCGAALVIAGLLAEGETVISDVYHIDRGYDNIDGKLRALGGVIRREKIDETLA